MMEKLSADEFNKNLDYVLEKLDNALLKANKTRDDVILLAATKTVDVDTINYAISKGINYIGENRVQELLSKDDDVVGAHRHFIGHLQTNKVKDIINRVELIQSVHSLKLAKEISKQAVKNNRNMDILLEVNIGNEESKSGFLRDEVLNAVVEISKLPNIFIKGLMAIPPICENSEDNRKYFKEMYKLFIDIGAKKIDNINMNTLSMGMSGDYVNAILEGANLARVGSAIFGARIYR